MSQDRESFASLFAKEGLPDGHARRLEVGDEVEGVVAHIGRDTVFVELDGKRQGYLEAAELLGKDGRVTVALGDTLKARVLSTDGGEIRLGRGFGRDAGRAELEVAHAQGVAIEGKVEEVVKGGVTVGVGGLRAFCPISQLDDRFVADPASYVGQVFSFAVVELDDRGAVLSRRRVLEAEAAEARDALLGELEVGAIRRGRVREVRDFGAFVDLGGIDGLIPVRELGHDRSLRAEDVVSAGDVVEVKVLGFEEKESKRGEKKLEITLSLRALAADPWEGIATIAPIGQVVSGQVTRLAEFGAFVRLAPGIEGLLHVSELQGARPEERFEVGDSILCVVGAVDPVRHRISLQPAADGAAPGERAANLKPVLGAIVDVKVEKIERFGAFVQIEGIPGRAGRGLIPNSELALKDGVDVRKSLPLDAPLRAKVIDATEGKLRLSVRAALAEAERAELDRFRAEQAAPKSMGTLGDLLAAKLRG